MDVNISTIKHPHQKVFHTLDKNELIITKTDHYIFVKIKLVNSTLHIYIYHTILKHKNTISINLIYKMKNGTIYAQNVPFVLNSRGWKKINYSMEKYIFLQKYEMGQFCAKMFHFYIKLY